MVEDDVQPQVVVCPKCRVEYPDDVDVCPACGKPLCDPQDLARIGLCFGSYEITDIIGVGGMGVVYRATHTTLLKPVAIKILNERYGQRRDAAREMLREAQAASRIRHPHIVDVTDFGTTEDGAPYFVMEYLEGQSLNELLGRVGRLPVGRAAKMMQQAAGALVAAHKQGIIHRDLKPENIFLLDLTASDPTQPGDFVKILDFGLAKVLDMGPSSRTRAGMLAGTPWYMSPEQAQNKSVDPRSDIYSLGIVFYQMVTGTVPFNGESAVDILMGHISAAVIQPYKYCGTIDEMTNRVIMRCLEKAAEDRFQTMEDLSIALERCGTELRLESGEILPDVKARRGGPAAVGQGAPTVTSELVGQVVGPGAVMASAPVTNPTEESNLVQQVLSTSQPTLAPLDVGPPRPSLTVDEPRGTVRRPGARWLSPLLAGAAALGIAAALVFGLSGPSSPGPGVATGATADLALSAPPAKVQVTLVGVPAGARVLLDDRATTGPIALVPSDRQYRVRVEAEGFEPAERSFVAARDMQLVFRLEPRKMADEKSSNRSKLTRRRRAAMLKRRAAARRRAMKAAAKTAAAKTASKVKQPDKVKQPEPDKVKPEPDKVKQPDKVASTKKTTKPPPTKKTTKPQPKKKYQNWVVEPDL